MSFVCGTCDIALKNRTHTNKYKYGARIIEPHLFLYKTACVLYIAFWHWKQITKQLNLFSKWRQNVFFHVVSNQVYVVDLVFPIDSVNIAAIYISLIIYMLLLESIGIKVVSFNSFGYYCQIYNFVVYFSYKTLIIRL